MAGTDLDSFTTFGDLLKYLRRRARLTQRELGIAVGYSESQITRLESGQRAPDAVMVEHQFVEPLDLKRDTEAAKRLIALAKTASVIDAEPTTPVAPATPNNLPVQLTHFIGREAEVAEVQNLLDAHRLVTLTGSGGIGKTRLTLEVAGGVLDQYKDGVWLVELAPLAYPALLPRTVANVMGLQEQRDTPILDAITDYLRDKHLLLILDNCEHLIDASARLAEGVLKQSHAVRILASSREVLGVAGELAWRVPSLPPDEAVQLFVERAIMANQAFALTPLTTPSVQTICTRLDGIPLAIELAAARVRALPVEKIAERLNDRFRLLTGGSRTALPRQQTLRGAIDWSYSLLFEPERTLLRRLAVFVGGWTLEAAESVCSEGLDDVLDTLTRLVDKSLVTVDESGRYRLLETIRQYAREKLADMDEGMVLRNKHLQYYAQMAMIAEPQLRRAQPETLDRVEVEIDNIRAGLEWAREDGSLINGLCMATALHWFWVVRGHQMEGIDWLRLLLSNSTSQEITIERGLAYVSLADFYARYDDARDLQHDAAQKSWGIASELGMPRELVSVYFTMAIVLLGKGDSSAARAYLEQALPIVAASGDQYLTKMYVSYMSGVERSEGHIALATQYLIKPLMIDPDDLLWSGPISRIQGYDSLDQGDYATAALMFRDSLLKNVKAVDRQGIAACLTAYAGLAMKKVDYIRVGKLLGAAEAFIDVVHAPLQPSDMELYRSYRADLVDKLDDATLKSARDEGRAMTMQQAIAYALQE